MVATRHEAAYAPPTDAEKWVIGSALVDPGCLPGLLRTVRPDDFADAELREVFSLIAKLHRSGQPVDVALLLDDLKRSPYIDNARDLLTLIAGEIHTSAHAEYYAKIVRDAATKRRIYEQARITSRDAMNGRSVGEVLADLSAFCEDEYRNDCSAVSTFTKLTSAQLASGDFELEYLIDGALVAGQPAVIGGAQKTLKTSIAVDLAVSLATAGYFLGRLPVARPCSVLMMSGESGLATLQETATRICCAAGAELADLDRLVWSDTIPRFDRAEHLEALGQLLDGDSIEVLIVDPCYLAMPSQDAGNVFAQGELLRAIGELCQRRGVTLVVLHHTKRNLAKAPDDVPSLEDLAWSGFAEFFRQWLLIGRREPYKPGTGEHRLWLNVGGSAGHTGLWALTIREGLRSDPAGRHWSVNVESGADAAESDRNRRDEDKQRRDDERAQQRAAGDREAVARALARIGKPETATEIAAASRLPNNRAKAALLELVEAGDAAEATIEKGNNRAYPGYQLCQQQ